MSIFLNHRARRHLLKPGTATAVVLMGLATAVAAPENAISSKSLGGLKYWPGANATSERQTIWFELNALPGDVFRIVVPELVSDNHGDYLPWGHPSPGQWQFERDKAAFDVRIEGVIHTTAEVLLGDQQIEVRVTVTNLSEKPWTNTNAFTCFTFTHAPSFDDKQMIRSFVRVRDQWQTLAELFQKHPPGTGALTFLGVQGGPNVRDLWVVEEIKQVCPQQLAQCSACMFSQDGTWIAGITTPTPAYVFNNAGLPCLHADPLLGDIAPGESATASSFIHVFRGTPADFSERIENREVPNLRE
jgi:hypothetical protein